MTIELFSRRINASLERTDWTINQFLFSLHCSWMNNNIIIITIKKKKKTTQKRRILPLSSFPGTRGVPKALFTASHRPPLPPLYPPGTTRRCHLTHFSGRRRRARRDATVLKCPGGFPPLLWVTRFMGLVTERSRTTPCATPTYAPCWSPPTPRLAVRIAILTSVRTASLSPWCP